jgi:hypothetical protein
MTQAIPAERTVVFKSHISEKLLLGVVRNARIYLALICDYTESFSCGKRQLLWNNRLIDGVSGETAVAT